LGLGLRPTDRLRRSPSPAALVFRSGSQQTPLCHERALRCPHVPEQIHLTSATSCVQGASFPEGSVGPRALATARNNQAFAFDSPTGTGTIGTGSVGNAAVPEGRRRRRKSPTLLPPAFHVSPRLSDQSSLRAAALDAHCLFPISHCPRAGEASLTRSVAQVGHVSLKYRPGLA
jgi:hypothetical protein